MWNEKTCKLVCEPVYYVISVNSNIWVYFMKLYIWYAYFDISCLFYNKRNIAGTPVSSSFPKYLYLGFKYGFRIGYNKPPSNTFTKTISLLKQKNSVAGEGGGWEQLPELLTLSDGDTWVTNGVHPSRFRVTQFCIRCFDWPAKFLTTSLIGTCLTNP